MNRSQDLRHVPWDRADEAKGSIIFLSDRAVERLLRMFVRRDHRGGGLRKMCREEASREADRERD